ncbi:murein biosynthesis integral membrane protein MurJ [Corynebacterium aquatimens]|nr:murein biosynthesis integral membrane protein MurJ [Corynebacterium aquatimens]WJY66939.1 putative peptidoglycan biosynthesis protein MviN [Corynebacterium aquatimens]
MAVATLLSRITGFIRTVLITSALGGAIASAFNTANVLPNMITEIVLGSVLTALVVPVLVRAEQEDPDHGAAFIRRLFTLTITLLSVVTVVAVIAAPLLTRLLLVSEGKVNLGQSTAFAYLLLPQIFFYGLFSLFMAVLNTKEVFRPGAWAPVVNNLVSIAVLCAYLLLPGSLHPDEAVSITDPHVLLLGLGTTAGVVVQCLIMLPALKRLKIDLRPLWGIDDRLKQFGGMALAIISYVAISQVGYIFNNRIADNADASAPVIYMQHWMLLQVPYGIIGVTLLTAIMPRLSRNAAHGDDKAVVRDLTVGTKLTFIALIPIIIFLTALGPDIGNALFGYGNFTTAEARTLGLTLSFSAFTLIPYALVMLHLRVFYAREEAWTPTFIIAGITITKVALAFLAPVVADRPQDVVVLLGAANGFGFIAGALVGSILLRRRLGSLGTPAVLLTSAWAAGAGLVGLLAAWLVRMLLRAFPGTLSGFTDSLGLRESVGLLVEISLLGIIFVIVTGVVLAFSGLPEVASIGQVLRRIPGLNKVIKPAAAPEESDMPAVSDSPDVADVADQLAAPADPREVSSQVLAADSFNASPVPPPMSAGVVRGPRLVPGAAVSDGRFRLLRHHGSTAEAQFWQAREQETGRDVALVFVDTCGSDGEAVTPRQAAIDAAGICHRTNKLAALNLNSVAGSIETIRYRTGCVVVADWVPGSSIQAVASSGETLSGEAVAHSLAPLTDNVAQAHEAGIPLGLHHRDQLRVSEDGFIVLAFPMIMPRAEMSDDSAALASALELLSGAARSTDLADAAAAAQDLASDDAAEADDFRALAGQLDAIGTAPPQEVQTVTNEPVTTPPIPHAPEDRPEEPDTVSGFGDRGMGTGATIALLIVAVITVLIAAALTTYFVGVLGKNNPDTPVAESVAEGDGSAKPGRANLPVLVRPLSPELWRGTQGSDQDTAAGSYGNEDLANLVDDDPATEFTINPQMAIKLVSGDSNPPPTFQLNQVLITTSKGDMDYTVYALTEDNLSPTNLTDLRVLDTGTLHNGQNQIDVTSTPVVSGIIVAFQGERADLFDRPDVGPTPVGEIAMVGLRALP